MKRLIKFYDGVAEWLCHFTADKYVHFVVVGFICWAVAFFDVLIWHRPASVAASIAVIAAFLIALTKEIADFFRGEDFDGKDLLFGCVGAIIVAAAFWLTSLIF